MSLHGRVSFRSVECLLAGRVESLLVDWNVASFKDVLGYGILDRSMTLS